MKVYTHVASRCIKLVHIQIMNNYTYVAILNLVRVYCIQGNLQGSYNFLRKLI